MATCLSDMKCPEENQHYAVLCEFWVGRYDDAPGLLHT